jgi:hypothetical protein
MSFWNDEKDVIVNIKHSDYFGSVSALALTRDDQNQLILFAGKNNFPSHLFL